MMDNRIDYTHCVPNVTIEKKKNEALPGGGGYLFRCSHEINWLVHLFPKNRKFVF